MLRAFLLMTVFLFSEMAQAGGWVGTGGDLYKDQHNPWFVRNTNLIRYCLRVEEPAISASSEKINSLIEQAFRYWKAEFAWLNGQTPVKVATQDFEKVPCDGTEDIRFLFGRETLDEQQLNFFKASQTPIQQVIATSVRTSYDRVQLKGKGFIFFNSDRGPNSYESGTLYVRAAWKYDALLYRAIAHEIGHVFGLPHVGHGLMATRFVEEMLDRVTYVDWVDLKLNLGSFFTSMMSKSTDCDRTSEQRGWFGLRAQQKCIHLEPHEKTGELRVYSSDSADSAKTLIGRITEDPHQDPEKKQKDVDMEFSSGVELWLPPEQKVFTEKETKNARFLAGPGFMSHSQPILFHPVGAKAPKPAFLRQAPSQQQITGVENGSMRILFNKVGGKRMHVVF